VQGGHHLPEIGKINLHNDEKENYSFRSKVKVPGMTCPRSKVKEVNITRRDVFRCFPPLRSMNWSRYMTLTHEKPVGRISLVTARKKRECKEVTI
jgi:hypothetical protein